jgi:hypothetical protein
MGKPRLNLIGMRFGKLQVTDFVLPHSGTTKFKCMCDCGCETVIIGSDLKSGNSKSCGCGKVDAGYTANLQHGGARGSLSRTYIAWRSMKQRCSDPNCIGWADYGGRGISVCERWANSYADFLSDMGEKPTGYSIERIDVNGNYCLENCKWIPLSEQSKNKRNSVKYEYKGRVVIQNDLSKMLGIDNGRLLSMRKAGNLPQGITEVTR